MTERPFKVGDRVEAQKEDASDPTDRMYPGTVTKTRPAEYDCQWVLVWFDDGCEAEWMAPSAEFIRHTPAPSAPAPVWNTNLDEAPEDASVLVTVRTWHGIGVRHSRDRGWTVGDMWFGDPTGEILAWMPLPQPYQPEKGTDPMNDHNTYAPARKKNAWRNSDAENRERDARTQAVINEQHAEQLAKVRAEIEGKR